MVNFDHIAVGGMKLLGNYNATRCSNNKSPRVSLKVQTDSGRVAGILSVTFAGLAVTFTGIRT